MRFMYGLIYWVVWPFFNLCHPCKAIGRENIPEGPVILCPNHTGLADPLMAAYAITSRYKPKIMAKAEVLAVPVLGWLLEKAGVFAVNRGNSDMGAIKLALKYLKSGEKLLIFPEGTRSKTGELGEGKSGVAMLSVRTGTPLLPMYIPAKKKWFARTPVIIGEPYMPQTAGPKGTSEEYESIVKDLMGRIAALGEGTK